MERGPIFERAAVEGNWGVFRLTPTDARLEKKPVHPKSLSVCDRRQSATMTFSEACEVRDAYNILGTGADWLEVGYLARPGSAITSLDFDSVADAGRLTEVGEAIVKRHGGHAQISPSGGGLRLLTGRPPMGFWNRETNKVGYYGSDRVMVTVTDNDLPGFSIVLPPTEFVFQTMQGLERKDPAREVARSNNPYAWFDRLTETEQLTCAAEMVAHLPTEWLGDYHRWLDVGFSLKRGGAHLFHVWDLWSKRVEPPSKYGETKSKWETMKQPSGQAPRTMGSLITEAIRHGWRRGPLWRERALRMERRRTAP